MAKDKQTKAEQDRRRVEIGVQLRLIGAAYSALGDILLQSERDPRAIYYALKQLTALRTDGLPLAPTGALSTQVNALKKWAMARVNAKTRAEIDAGAWSKET